jgi:hypothetical protein
MMARVFVYRVIDIGFLTVGLLKSGFDLESIMTTFLNFNGIRRRLLVITGGYNWKSMPMHMATNVTQLLCCLILLQYKNRV